MMGRAIYRRASADDAAAVAEVFTAAARAAWSTFLGTDRLQAWAASPGEWHERLSAQGDGRWWVAMDAGGVCAFAQTRASEDVDADDRTGEVHLFYAHPRTWGSGVARELHHRAIDDLCDARFARATLWTEQRNSRALAFYRSEGWEPDGVTRDREFLDAPIHEVRLVRQLP